MSDDDSGIQFEASDESNESLGAQLKLKKLHEELKESQKKAAEYLDGWQRCKADSVNARRDALRDAERESERAKTNFVEDVLPALDSFDMAMGAENWDTVSEDWRAGLNHIRTQLLDALQKNGVERFGKTGEMFDPRQHEAVQEMEDVAGESHSIIRVLRHGYRAGERLVRPAQVIIKK